MKDVCALYINIMSQTFYTLLVRANEKSIHQNCLEFLTIEVYKYFNGLLPQIMNDVLSLEKAPTI